MFRISARRTSPRPSPKRRGRKIKTVLICYYWSPWNCSGAFRWVHFSKVVDIDLVITCRKPRKGFYDDTMPLGKSNMVWRCGRYLPAFFGGLVLAVVSIFVRADKYIYTAPPESLLVGCWINQKLGRKVFVDMRDRIDRLGQPLKFMVRVYDWFYKRINKVVVCHKFIDERKDCIESGYEELTSTPAPRQRGEKQRAFMAGRFRYDDYIRNLELGIVPDFGQKVTKNGKIYGSLSLITVRKMGIEVNKDWFHPDCFDHEVCSWEEQGEKMRRWIDEREG